MKNIPLFKPKIILFFIVLFSLAEIHSQEINFDNLSFGVALNYKVPTGDFGKYWGNSPGIGGIIKYELANPFSFEGIFSVSYFTPIANEDKYPNILLLNMPAGLEYSVKMREDIFTNLAAGISNTTMVFSGEAAEIVEENNIESELGVFASVGFGKTFEDLFRIEVFSRVQNIFTSPENIILYNFGIKVLFVR